MHRLYEWSPSSSSACSTPSGGTDPSPLAAKELSYTQPSLSHHLARLEAQTGAKLLQKVGRGIRLTEAGRLLADRAAEIIGRVDAATAELSTLVGLDAGHVRLAGFGSVMSSLVPEAAGDPGPGAPRPLARASPTPTPRRRCSCCGPATSTSP